MTRGRQPAAIGSNAESRRGKPAPGRQRPKWHAATTGIGAIKAYNDRHRAIALSLGKTRIFRCRIELGFRQANAFWVRHGVKGRSEKKQRQECHADGLNCYGGPICLVVSVHHANLQQQRIGFTDRYGANAIYPFAPRVGGARQVRQSLTKTRSDRNYSKTGVRLSQLKAALVKFLAYGRRSKASARLRMCAALTMRAWCRATDHQSNS